MSVVADLTERLKDVRSWNSLEIPSERINFTNYGIQAINELGQDAVPSFNGSEHFNPSYTGFVRHLVVIGGSFVNIIYKEDADFAYIENGKIRYTQKDKSRLDQGLQGYAVSWRDNNFRVDEKYGGSGFPSDTAVTLVERVRTAEFISSELGIKVEVTQDQNEKLRFRIDEYNESRKQNGYGLCGVIEIELMKDDPQYNQVLAALQANPDSFTDPRNALHLFQGMKIHNRSNVYCGFRDGEYREGPLAPRVIQEILNFEDAVKIAFPKLLEKQT